NVIRREKLRMKCGSFYIAKDRPSKSQGDDSHFIYGMGGWSKHGVDAGLYVAELINNSLLATLALPLTQVDPMKMLHAVNVGDSRFMVIRRGEIIYKSLIQLQFSVIKVRVEVGYMIIAGTNGLFDNLFELQILATTSKRIKQNLDAEEMAWEMAQLAYHTSRDKSAVTPFMKASKRVGRFRDGGKGDDITVIVSHILGA
ncbi:hypothetical protein ERO13_A08G112250v2, partial [Gossypium hirsutum]